MDVRYHQMKDREDWGKDLYVFNPDIEEFRWKYNGETYVIQSHEILPFKKPIAMHLAKHLVDHLCNKHENWTEAKRKDYMNMILEGNK
jgi:hypothetical protein